MHCGRASRRGSGICTRSARTCRPLRSLETIWPRALMRWTSCCGRITTTTCAASYMPTRSSNPRWSRSMIPTHSVRLAARHPRRRAGYSAPRSPRSSRTTRPRPGAVGAGGRCSSQHRFVYYPARRRWRSFLASQTCNGTSSTSATPTT